MQSTIFNAKHFLRLPSIIASGIILCSTAASAGEILVKPADQPAVAMVVGSPGTPTAAAADSTIKAKYPESATTQTALIHVKDVKGSYAIPYIQSDRQLQITVDFSAAGAVVADLRLEGPEHLDKKTVRRDSPTAVFGGLPAGEFQLAVEWRDGAGKQVTQTLYKKIGVGCVLAAIGDSLTEGYHGRGFMMESLDLKAADFPTEAVSKDGRNFPQYAPTTFQHKPSVNCFQSWMTSLNDRLALSWKMPVFIANEGWGGITSARYLAVMRGNGDGWRDRMRQLKPSVWLIHLGVNDERQKVSAEVFAANMREIVGILRTNYDADPSQIYLSYPSYDYAPGAESVLRSYIVEIDRIIAELGVRKGPDFFAAFSTDRAKWYGSDPVHPGVEGVELMAELWAKTLVAPPLQHGTKDH